MTEDKSIKDAIDSYVESLEEEEKRNKLIENNSKKIESGTEAEINGLEEIKQILKKSIELICLGEEVKIDTDSEELKLSVQGEDLGIAIGRDGKNMQALEYIINLIGKRKKLVDRNVIIDIKDYRKKKIEKIKKTAVIMAKKAISEGRKIALKPMCAYERKIIHNALTKFKDVTTRSRYEEPNRSIIIYPIKGSK
ncbi:MAG: R3H domain-containing nucleic acid-binding protein [Candidatus Hydromicrobium sp.]|nr:R3H domain-containing nucleic acid-binding protein [Candidatus Hydromicrobium sp.]